MTQPQGFSHFLFRSWHAGPHCLPAFLQGHAMVLHLDLQPHTNVEDEEEEDDDEEDEEAQEEEDEEGEGGGAGEQGRG